MSFLIPAKDLFGPKPELDRFWRDRAACKDHRSIFLADFSHSQIAEKRKNQRLTQSICMQCPVRLHCLWLGIESYEEFFMYGGATPEQLKEIRTKILRKGVA